MSNIFESFRLWMSSNATVLAKVGDWSYHGRFSLTSANYNRFNPPVNSVTLASHGLSNAKRRTMELSIFSRVGNVV